MARLQRRPRLLLFLAVFALLTAPPLARGDEVDGSSDAASDGNSEAVSDESSGWEFIVTPYFWFPETEGTITADGVSVPTDMSFSDLVDQLNYGFIGAVEARNGRWMVLADVFYANLEDDFDVGPLSIDLEIDQLLLGASIGYRVLSRPVRTAFLGGLGIEEVGVSIDLLVGGRYWNIQQEIDMAAAGMSASVDSSEHWLDSYVGARLRAALTDRLTLGTVFEVGGFGIGSASDSTWHWALTATYRFGERWSAIAGYRILSLDQASGSGADRVETNTKMFGPVLGLSYRF